MAMRPLPFRFGGPFHSSDATLVMLIADVGKAGNKQSNCLSDARQMLTSVLLQRRISTRTGQISLCLSCTLSKFYQTLFPSSLPLPLLSES